MKKYYYNLVNDYPKSIFKALGILLAFYLLFSLLFGFLSLILTLIFDFQMTMIFPSLGFLFAAILSSIYYRKTIYSFFVISFSIFFIFTTISFDINDSINNNESSEKQENSQNESKEKSQNNITPAEEIKKPKNQPEPVIVIEKTKEEINKEILQQIKKGYPEGHKHINYVDAFDDWINIVLNTDSKLSDKYGNDYGSVLAGIHIEATIYSCGEDYWYDKSYFFMCDYDPYKIKIFNKSGKEVYYFGKDFDGESSPSTYYTPKKYPN